MHSMCNTWGCLSSLLAAACGLHAAIHCRQYGFEYSRGCAHVLNPMLSAVFRSMQTTCSCKQRCNAQCTQASGFSHVLGCLVCFNKHQINSRHTQFALASSHSRRSQHELRRPCDAWVMNKLHRVLGCSSQGIRCRASLLSMREGSEEYVRMNESV